MKVPKWLGVACCLFFIASICSCSSKSKKLNDYKMVKIHEMGNEDNTNEELFGDIGSIAVDKNGWLYVADRAFNTIKKFDQDGKFIKKWGGTGSGPEEFSLLFRVLTDSKGNVFVLDSGNHKLAKFDPDGKFLKSIPIRINTGQIRMTSDDKLFLLTWQPPQNTIEQFDNDLVFTGQLLEIKNNANTFATYDFLIQPPWAICLDIINGKIQRYNWGSGTLVREDWVDNQEIVTERMRRLKGKSNSPNSGMIWGLLSPFSSELYTLSFAFELDEKEDNKNKLIKKSFLYSMDGAYCGKLIIESGPEWYRDIFSFNEYIYTFDQTKIVKYKLLKSEK